MGRSGDPAPSQNRTKVGAGHGCGKESMLSHIIIYILELLGATGFDNVGHKL